MLYFWHQADVHEILAQTKTILDDDQSATVDSIPSTITSNKRKRSKAYDEEKEKKNDAFSDMLGEAYMNIATSSITERILNEEANIEKLMEKIMEADDGNRLVALWEKNLQKLEARLALFQEELAASYKK